MPIILNTYSIVAHDPDEKAWGVAVASKFPAVGAVVSWARAEVGAVATQSFVKIGFGPNGLALMEQGHSAQETLDILLSNDSQPGGRQVGLVDANGEAAAYTGPDCFDWAGHIVGEGFTCQGNILTGGETLDAMAETFTATKGELADRLVAALLAGDTVGGDKRGKQAAAVLVVKLGGGYGGDTDRYLDLRVDDHREPVKELERILAIHHLFFGETDPNNKLPITEDIARELQTMMLRLGYYNGEAHGRWDAESIKAFRAFTGNENLEERWSPDKEPELLDKVVLDYLRDRFGQ